MVIANFTNAKTMVKFSKQVIAVVAICWMADSWKKKKRRQ